MYGHIKTILRITWKPQMNLVLWPPFWMIILFWNSVCNVKCCATPLQQTPLRYHCSKMSSEFSLVKHSHTYMEKYQFKTFIGTFLNFAQGIHSQSLWHPFQTSCIHKYIYTIITRVKLMNIIVTNKIELGKLLGI